MSFLNSSLPKFTVSTSDVSRSLTMTFEMDITTTVVSSWLTSPSAIDHPPAKYLSLNTIRSVQTYNNPNATNLKPKGFLVDPKLYDLPILHVSPSWIQQKGCAKHKKLQECSLDELRFITAFNTLNDSIRPKPTTSCSANSIFLFLARWKNHIFADLNNSYFQLPVKHAL